MEVETAKNDMEGLVALIQPALGDYPPPSREDVLEADNCVDGICYFEESKSRLLLRQFRGGRTAHVTIKDRQGRELFDAPITLMGFSAAYKLY